MGFETLTLREAAAHVHLDEHELKHAAQRGELPAQERGGEWFFLHRDLDEWAQRDLLAASRREQLRRHAVIMDENRRAHHEDWRVWELIPAAGVRLDLVGRTKAGVLRDMCELAEATELVYDGEGLFRELKAREDIASTAVGEGAAFLHPRFHDPYLFERSFVVYARSVSGVFFGAADGEATRHFFLVCANDHETHLHILSRLAVMTHATEFLTLLDEAETPERALAVIRAAEEGFVGR